MRNPRITRPMRRRASPGTAIGAVGATLLSACVATLTGAAPLVAQSASGETPAERRFRFAELYVGAEAASIGGASGAVPVPGRIAPRVAIGGLHFWGRADFAVLFPVAGRTIDRDGVPTQLDAGVETRARLHLRPIARAGWTPYVGGALGAVDVQVGDGPRVYQFRPVLQAGVATRVGNTLIDVGWSHRPGSALRYPVARDRMTSLNVAPHGLVLGVHRLFETTAPLIAEVDDGRQARREQAWRDAGKLSGPSLAIGATSLILTGAMDWNTTQRPWLAARPRAGTSLDLGVGWYDERRDAHVNLAWRRGAFTTSAFDYRQENTRASIALEAFKFLGDYHGFVPFVGPVVSLNRLSVREHDAGVEVTSASRTLLAPGVTFGWDIRPTRTQTWLLRTNLRWFPRLRVPVPGGEQTLDQLEFNFIQLVWYPKRRG